MHLRHLSPLPRNLGALFTNFKQILVPEMNMGQLSTLLRDKLGVDPTPYCKVTGQPFLISELVEKMRSILSPSVVSATEPVAKGEYR
jgi:2-oxoglutarate ferredoxin oxidoreductase subunit alpha